MLNSFNQYAKKYLGINIKIIIKFDTQMNDNSTLFELEKYLSVPYWLASRPCILDVLGSNLGMNSEFLTTLSLTERFNSHPKL